MATTKHPKIIIVIVCVIFLFCGAGYYLGAFGTGLASDEEMIAHFKEHRAEIEELVKRYREFDPETAAEPKLVSVKHANGTWEDRYVKDHTLWIEQNDTRALAKKAGVDIHWSGMGIFGDSNFGGNRTIWLPNPYSIESGELFDSMTKDKYNEIFYRRGMLRVQ
ncbi:MAG: hypothetical protein LBS73_01985, partial [Campylobacteraceae bacterium]|nr:hypothetical protein [Campylobacteraceae bacterium]